MPVLIFQSNQIMDYFIFILCIFLNIDNAPNMNFVSEKQYYLFS